MLNTFDYEWDEKPQEECGVLGIYAPGEEVARLAYFGLHALQHRGQESAGIAAADGRSVALHKDMGLVSNVFTPANLAPLKGELAVGHTRYSTTGSSVQRNAQPFVIDTRHGTLALAHNGNLVNSSALRQALLAKGVGLSTTTDTEVMTMMLAAAEGDTWNERLQATMPLWQGAYSIVLLTRDSLYAARDPWGFRPLSVGMLPNGGHVVASEVGALLTLSCVGIREVQPGEIVQLSSPALKVHQAVAPHNPLAICIFEDVYFSRPDGVLDGHCVHLVRQNLGKALATEAPVDADVVIPVPDSSIPAAIGYAAQSGIPYNDGFIKNRYIGRTFIQPTDSLRKQGIALKFNVIQENILNKRVVMIDDSIVRGNTIGQLVKMLRDAGAKEIHLRITCPPIKHPCYMGVDMGTYDELIAHTHTLEEIRHMAGSDTLHFLSLDGMMRAVGDSKNYCNACFNGIYPFEVAHHHAKNGFETASR